MELNHIVAAAVGLLMLLALAVAFTYNSDEPGDESYVRSFAAIIAVVLAGVVCALLGYGWLLVPTVLVLLVLIALVVLQVWNPHERKVNSQRVRWVAASFIAVVALIVGILVMFDASNPNRWDNKEAREALNGVRTTTSTTRPSTTTLPTGIGVCEGVTYKGLLPPEGGKLFGSPVVERRMADVNAVRQRDWCEYAVIAYAGALHRNIPPLGDPNRVWPLSDHDQLGVIDQLHTDRAKHANLVQMLVNWQKDNVQSSVLEQNPFPAYFTDLAERQPDGRVLLRYGNGDHKGPGWVIHYRLKKTGEILTERLDGRWQLVTGQAISRLRFMDDSPGKATTTTVALSTTTSTLLTAPQRATPTTTSSDLLSAIAEQQN